MKNEPVAVVLAGGAGKRWWPLMRYKSLFPFAGKPAIAYVLEQLPFAGIKEAIVVTNPNDLEAMSRLSVAGVNVTVVVQQTPNGMAGAVLAAKDAIGVRPVLVLNAQDLVDARLYETIGSEMTKGKPFVVGTRVPSYVDFGYLKLRGDFIEAIIEKPGAGHESSDYVNLVFHYFSESTVFLKLLGITRSSSDDVYEQALSRLVKTIDVALVRYEGKWAPLKYPWHVLDVMDRLLAELSDHKGKNVELKQNVVIEGPVWIGDNVKVFENTKIVGPCYVGDNTIIGNNNIIRGSHIGRGCVTGFNSDITRSYIGDTCWFHSNYIGDSVLEEDISMGSGTVLANLRLDRGEIANSKRRKLGALIGKNVRIGVNTSIMPGVKIGHDSMVGAGLVVSRDIPDASKKLL